jgi:tetratricopeptide (TPR) repeat protein
MSFFKRLFSLGEDRDYKRGMALFNAHRYHEAAEAFQVVSEKKSTQMGLYQNLSRFYASQAHHNLGTVAFVAGNFGEALRQFQKAIELNPEHVDLNYFLGVCYNNLGGFMDALDAFKKALAIDPDHFPTRMKLAVVFHNQKMWDSAAQTYRSILKQKPGYADIYYRLGLALLGEGEINDAVAAFESAIGINPNYTEARIKAGIARAQQGDTTTALNHLRYVVERCPNFADVHYLIGLVLEHETRFKEAAQSIERALAINPSYRDAKVKLAVVYVKLSRYLEALEVFKSVAGPGSDDPGLQLAGAVIQTSLEAHDQNPEKIGRALEEVLGDSGSIPGTIEKSCCRIDITPHFTEMISLLNIGRDDREMLPIKEMLIPLLESYVAAHPTYPDLHNGLGTLYLKLGQVDAARNAFQEAVRLNPNYRKARIDLLKVLVRSKKFTEALTHGEFLLSQGVRYPDVFLAMGEAEYGLSRYDNALAHAESALAGRSAYAEAYYLTGQALERKEKCDLAAIAYAKCLKPDVPQDLKEDAKKAINRLMSIAKGWEPGVKG